MTLSDEIESLVVTRATGSEIRQVALEQGMVSLRDDGWSKVDAGPHDDRRGPARLDLTRVAVRSGR